MDLDKYIAVIPNYPIEGIMFRDVTSLIQDKDAFQYAIDQLTAYAKSVGADVIVGPESRGFIFGCPVAYNLNIGFVPARKPNKLPRAVIKEEYELEYGTNVLEMHADAIRPGQKVVVIDDLLATGGTIAAASKMVERLGGEVVGCAFIIELDGLGGREKLNRYNVFSLVTYQE